MSESVERGVQNPRVVDLIGPDPDTGAIVLTVLEERAWGTHPEQLHQLQEKLNSYLGYVLDGYLKQDYPEYDGKPVHFQLDCASKPGPVEDGFLIAFRNYATSQNIGFAVKPRDA